jgi:adenylate kinase
LNSEISVCLSLIVDDEILVSRLVKRGETSGRVDDSKKALSETELKNIMPKLLK